jgi:ribonuclease J
MTKLTFFGGKDEIGGNKILVEDKGSRLFLDFGTSFDILTHFFADFLQPKKGNGLSDYFELGLLPKMDGLYRKDYLEHMKIKPKNRSVDGVLLSHAHFDHMGMVNFLRIDIPIFCSEETKRIMEIFDITSNGEFVKATPTFQYYPNKSGGISRWDKRKGQNTRNVHVVEDGTKFDVGNMRVTSFRVDHSLPGAMGYVIETSDKTIVYTGDIRFHGKYPELSNNFVEKVSKFEPDILLCEGTRVNEKSNKTEEWVEQEATKVIKDTEGLAIINYPPRDLSRIQSIFRASQDAGRKLVVDFKQSLLLQSLNELGHLPNLQDVLVYAQPKSWYLIDHDDADSRQVELDYIKWEREVLKLNNLVKTNEIKNHQDRYVFFCSDFSVGSLVDIKPVEGSTFTRSMCEPFDDEMAIDRERIEHWYDHFGINTLRRHQIHCSGHASYPDLKKMVEKINPKMLMPIHTEHPELFKEFHNNVKILKSENEINL